MLRRILMALREAEWFDARRARDYPRLLAICWAGGLAFLFLTGAMATQATDFGAFWAAGRLAWRDPPLAWDFREVQLLQGGFADHRWAPFVNPPPFLFVVAPFALLQLPAAHVLWFCATLAAYLAAGRRMLGAATLAAFPVVFFNGMGGQNGLLTGAILTAGATQIERRPFIAGLFFGALVIKPQLAVLLPLALVAGRQWRALAGTVVSSLGLLALSLFVFGPDSFKAFLSASTLSRDLLLSGAHALKQQTVFAFVLALGGGPVGATLAQAAAAVGAGILVVRVWRGSAGLLAKCSVLAAVTPLATPYLYIYDLAFWVIPIGWLAMEGARMGFLTWERLAIGLLFMAPLGQSFAGIAGVNIGPIVSLALAACVMRRLQRSPSPQISHQTGLTVATEGVQR